MGGKSLENEKCNENVYSSRIIIDTLNVKQETDGGCLCGRSKTSSSNREPMSLYNTHILQSLRSQSFIHLKIGEKCVLISCNNYSLRSLQNNSQRKQLGNNTRYFQDRSFFFPPNRISLHSSGQPRTCYITQATVRMELLLSELPDSQDCRPMPPHIQKTSKDYNSAHKIQFVL